MSLFGALVRTAVNVVCLPVEVAYDAWEVMTGGRPEHTVERLETLKKEAESDG